MVGHVKTYQILQAFYDGCVTFWLGEGETSYAAHRMALRDIEGIVTNPFSPVGETLNPDAKAEFLRVLERGL